MKMIPPAAKKVMRMPTSGGRTTGSATSVPRMRRPGKSAVSNRKASGIPMAAENATVASEIQMLAQSACHSSGRRANSAKCESVQ